MKKQIIRIYVLSLLLYLALHILTLTGVIDPVILWDDTINDTKTMIIAELIVIILLLLITVKFYRISRHLTSKNRLSLLRLLRLLLIFFLLELTGALMGVETSFKFFGTYYLLELALTLYSIHVLSGFRRALGRSKS